MTSKGLSKKNLRASRVDDLRQVIITGIQKAQKLWPKLMASQPGTPLVHVPPPLEIRV